VPELPEVEVLVRHLRPLLYGKVIHAVHVSRPRVLRPTSVRTFTQKLKKARFTNLSRRGKFLLFTLSQRKGVETMGLVGHLGMTGRMYLLSKPATLPKHTAVSMDLGDKQFVFEDTRYFGRLTLETGAIERLGPEPLSNEWTTDIFAEALRNSTQPIKVKLLDQSLVAGIGNIYASEALFRSGISPKIPARRLGKGQVLQLWRAIREVLAEAIDRGISQELDYPGDSKRLDGFFYFGRSAREDLPEPFSVYGRLGEPCLICGKVIRRLIQASRSTFYCPHCQTAKSGRR